MIQDIQHDGVFSIAIGNSRKETHWKNEEWSWHKLLTKLSITHRTAESVAEYAKAKRERQDEIKDIGGFVGGYLAGGKRKKNTILNRQLITLDVDFGKSDWSDFTMMYGCAAAMYTTHKHTADKPRYRILIPLTHEVDPEAYEAIARRIAGNVDIELFDDTGFQPSRLMYWPSTPRNGEYLFAFQDDAWLNPDTVLATYKDWTDSSEWPVSERFEDIVKRNIKKQGDPLEKPGIIGAFCRTKSIQEAIEEYLPDVYDACDVADRYTFRGGSTAAGLIVYDDVFAYSHHGTDPVSNKCCNAFDLVRLHKFGIMDEDAAEGTPITKLPSFKAMQNFATKQPEVRVQIGRERRDESVNDFEGLEDLWADATTDEGVVNLDTPSVPYDDSWLGELDADRMGNYFTTINNVVLIMNNDPYLKGRIAMNLFEHREVAIKDLPWRKITPGNANLTDKDDAHIRHYLEKVYGIASATKIRDAIDVVLNTNSFHPVKDYLNGLTWDGTERLDTLFIDYLGAEDTEYTRAVTRKMLVAAISRIYRPGCKFDNVCVLVGNQGIGKSTILARLGRGWFSDTLGNIQTKEAYEQLQGKWLIELAELAGLKKAEVETIKHFVSKQIDNYRVAYGRRAEDFARQCVFFGTTNNTNFLRDVTGNRRFWPIDTYTHLPVKSVFLDLTDAEVMQIWAEALLRYKEGETLHLDNRLEAMANSVQHTHVEQDERAGTVQQYLEMLLPDDWSYKGVYDRRAFIQDEEPEVIGTMRRDKVCIAEIWCEVLGGRVEHLTSQNTKPLHDIMRNMPGWAEDTKQRFPIYGVQRCYYRVQKSVLNPVAAR